MALWRCTSPATHRSFPFFRGALWISRSLQTTRWCSSGLRHTGIPHRADLQGIGRTRRKARLRWRRCLSGVPCCPCFRALASLRRIVREESVSGRSESNGKQNRGRQNDRFFPIAPCLPWRCEGYRCPIEQRRNRVLGRGAAHRRGRAQVALSRSALYLDFDDATANGRIAHGGFLVIPLPWAASKRIR